MTKQQWRETLAQDPKGILSKSNPTKGWTTEAKEDAAKLAKRAGVSAWIAAIAVLFLRGPQNLTTKKHVPASAKIDRDYLSAEVALAKEIAKDEPDRRPSGRRKKATVAKKKKATKKKATRKKKATKKRTKKKTKKKAAKKKAPKKRKKKSTKKKSAKKKSGLSKKQKSMARGKRTKKVKQRAKKTAAELESDVSDLLGYVDSLATELKFTKKALKTEQRRSMLAGKTVSDLKAAIERDKKKMAKYRKRLPKVDKRTQTRIRNAFSRLSKDLTSLKRLLVGEADKRKRKVKRKVPPKARQMEFKALFSKSTARAGAGCSLAAVKYGFDRRMCDPKSYKPSEAGRRLANVRHHGVAFNPDDYFAMGVEEGMRRAAKKNPGGKKKSGKKRSPKKAAKKRSMGSMRGGSRRSSTARSNPESAAAAVKRQIARL